MTQLVSSGEEDNKARGKRHTCFRTSCQVREGRNACNKRYTCFKNQFSSMERRQSIKYVVNDNWSMGLADK